MPAIDYKKGISPMSDIANRVINGKRQSRTTYISLITTPRNASWAADRAVKGMGYPLAQFTLPFNRDFFRVNVGGQFKFSYSKWGIVSMVCRVLMITEEEPGSSTINVQAIEDIDHISETIFGEAPHGKWPIEITTLYELENVSIIEAPYVLAGDVIQVIPLASKRSGTEIGFYVYMSIDGGSSYQKIGTSTTYQLYGTLAEPIGQATYQVDEDSDGILIDFDVAKEEDLDQIQTITRSQMISGSNLALLGSEIISFQTVTPVTSTRYRLSDIYWGRFDTENAAHSAGEDFWFIGTSLYTLISHSELVIGSSRKFKYVPFNSGYAGDISEASEVSHSVTGRAQTPYVASNLMANGSTVGRYTSDIALTWTSRIRGEGAGLGDPTTMG